MNIKYNIFFILLATFFCIGCQTSQPFFETSLGYARYNIDDIVTTHTFKGKTVKTKLDHVDSFIGKLRGGASIIEAIPQLRAGLEFRAGAGFTDDEVRDGDEEVYSEIVLLLFGAGPFVSWKQQLGNHVFIEAGGFVGAYTVGAHITGQRDYYYYYDSYWNESNSFYVNREETSRGGTGWSGGIFGKMGIVRSTAMPVSCALECAYEVGQWDFNGRIGSVNVDSFSILFSTEVQF